MSGSDRGRSASPLGTERTCVGLERIDDRDARLGGAETWRVRMGQISRSADVRRDRGDDAASRALGVTEMMNGVYRRLEGGDRDQHGERRGAEREPPSPQEVQNGNGEAHTEDRRRGWQRIQRGDVRRAHLVDARANLIDSRDGHRDGETRRYGRDEGI
jgi:hypothetical protein